MNRFNEDFDRIFKEDWEQQQARDTEEREKRCIEALDRLWLSARHKESLYDEIYTVACEAGIGWFGNSLIEEHKRVRQDKHRNAVKGEESKV